jgi:hypothetical protein
MDYYAGIDVSLEQSSVCVVDSSGKIVREAKVASEPEALVQHFADLGLPVVRIGLEAGPLSQWLREGLVEAGLEVVLLETRHVKAALSAMMTEADWAHTLEVFRTCLPRRGRKAANDRLFLEAMHFFTVENVRWRALPERFGPWNSVWKRFDQLSKAGVFEAFFDTQSRFDEHVGASDPDV